MRVLVTGGAGYVGSHVVKALVEAGHDPVVYDNLSTGHRAAVTDAELVVGDVCDPARLNALLRKSRFDGAIHLAAASLVGESMRNPARYFQNNVVAGLTLFDSLVAAEVPWLVLSSTAAVYGTPEQVPMTETHKQDPTNPYGDSKRMLERVLKWYEGAYGFRSVALRYFNAAGAHPEAKIGEDHTPETHLIPIIMQAALAQRDAVEVFGTDYATPDGTAIRDYVHVCDLANAHLAVMDRLTHGAATDAYNVGTEAGYSVLEVIEAVRRVTGKRVPVRMAARREGDPPILVANAGKAERELDWTRRFNLDTTVETAWRWHAAHPRGYR